LIEATHDAWIGGAYTDGAFVPRPPTRTRTNRRATASGSGQGICAIQTGGFGIDRGRN